MTIRAAILALLLLAFPALAEDITGSARVIDGDTIEVAGQRIRLHGIDAPESDQTCEWPGKTIPCGRLATTALMDLTAGVQVTCKTREKDRYGRWVAVCYDPDGFDIGKNMVHTGWALAYRRHGLISRRSQVQILPPALMISRRRTLKNGANEGRSEQGDQQAYGDYRADTGIWHDAA